MNIIEQLRELSRNLWWTWQPDIIALFHDIDAERWRQVNHNPVDFLSGVSRETIEKAVKDQALEARVSQAFHQLRAYLDQKDAWGHIHGGPLKERPVAYFSAEFGLHESLPIYSGGLGILAGDHLATASDFGLPLVGVGLFYARGYFTQHLDGEGRQLENYDEIDVEQLPLERVKTEAGERMHVEVGLGDRTLCACLWRADVGRCSLVLLDCDTEHNEERDRPLTSRLYDADPETRILQECVLGIGGMRALRRLGIHPAILHLNEGHSAFCTLENMREEVEENGVDVEEAKRRVRNRTVFTTHTPVPAGHDRFDPASVGRILGPLRERIGVAESDFIQWGQTDPSPDEPYCMTTLALRMSRTRNGVSARHGRTARAMWKPLWPDRPEDESPIGHITNGVHISSWLAPPLMRFFNEHLGPDWEQNQCDPETWSGILDVDDEQLWEEHQILKARMLESIVRWIKDQETRRNGGDEKAEYWESALHPDTLTIAFGRRMASYKRVDLLFRDEDRLAKWVNDDDRPIQLVFSGKAHPSDDNGKELIRRLFALSRSERFRGRLVFIEDYDINVARHLIQGCDVWLNTPLMPREACGTSGMKAMFNGALNLSVPDGWWAEAYDGGNGFVIGDFEPHADPEAQTERDAASLYDTLEHDVIPLYYDRDGRGIPHGWIQRMKNALSTLGWRFNSNRMLMQYAHDCYFPAVGGDGAI